MPAPLFDSLDSLEKALDAGPPFLCLDYDGTLVPIAPTPEMARMGRGEKSRLRRLAGLLPVAIISGRSLSEVRRMVGVTGLIYAGNHGLEILSEDFRFEAPTTRKWREDLSEMLVYLHARLHEVEGLRFEDKGVTASIHYRMVPRPRVPGVEEVFWGVVRPYADEGRVRVTRGKEVWELRPPIEWHKGKAVEYLLSQRGLSGRLPIYVGDDETDEDAFRAVGDSGIAVGVGEARRRGAAHYLLEGPEEVHRFLDWLAGRLS